MRREPYYGYGDSIDDSRGPRGFMLRAEIRPPVRNPERLSESNLRKMVESASQDLVALFIVADEEVEALGLPCNDYHPPSWASKQASPPMTERDRRWRERWR